MCACDNEIIPVLLRKESMRGSLCSKQPKEIPAAAKRDIRIKTGLDTPDHPLVIFNTWLVYAVSFTDKLIKIRNESKILLQKSFSCQIRPDNVFFREARLMTYGAVN